MLIEFEGEIFYWRGPSPFLFVAVPEAQSQTIKSVSALVSYGWGCIPVVAKIGATEWKTSLFPKQGHYLVPIRVSAQRAEKVGVGDWVELQIRVSGL
jgi:hypothetical protein